LTAVKVPPYAANPADRTVELGSPVSSSPRGVRVVTDPPVQGTALVDVSCRGCEACAVGRPYWCLSPTPEGRTLLTLRDAPALEDVRRWFSLVTAFCDAAVPGEDVVLVLTDAAGPAVQGLFAWLHPGPVLVSVDGRDAATRGALTELSLTGRAQVVVASHEARAAVRSVQRGGRVVLPDAEVDPPSVTELVQRDVGLVGPGSLARELVTADPAVLASLLDEVLRADTADGRSEPVGVPRAASRRPDTTEVSR
jgi:hypothetical protein